MKASEQTREQWLRQAAALMAPRYVELGVPLPERIRVSIGFTSGGRRGRSIGECWYPAASADQHHEIFIRPSEAGDVDVLAILAHELAHAAAGSKAKHGRDFKRIVDALGLESAKGRTGCRATTAGPAFKLYAKGLVTKLGELPHGKLNDGRQATTAPKTQTTRLIRCECPECGYLARITGTWLKTAGAPLCPQDKVALVHPELEEESDGE